MAKMHYEQAIPIFLSKAAALLVPAYIISRVWTAHPHLAFGLGLATGSVLQHFVPPRGKFVELTILILFAIVAALVDYRFGG